MVSAFLRDSFWGRTIYHLSSHKYFGYKEESKDYIVPEKYLSDLPKRETVVLDTPDSLIKNDDGNKEEASEEEKSQSSDVIIVDWDGDDDPENPYNWALKYKIIFTMQIAFLTTSVYLGSAIYTPAIEQIKEELGVSQTVAMLPLTLFVVGYGIGPMVFSPLSENAIFGRSSIYITTLFIFAILQIPTALVKNIAGLCILRFLAGFFASPCLATGGASVADVLPVPYIPVGIAAWAIGATMGPSLGPLIGAAVSVGGTWRWTFGFMGVISGFSFFLNGFLMPETYSKALLRRKAQRLRALTGNDKIKSEGEIENDKLTRNQFIVDTLWRPFQISIVEPVVLLINVYIALVYSIMYLWFEAFPIVFYNTYHFTLVTMGVAYVSLMVGIVLGALFYIVVIRKMFTIPMLNGQPITAEVFIPMAIVGSVTMPVGIFIFSWTSTASVHWIAPMIGAALFASGAFLIFQTLFNYMSMSFSPIYLASVFASNCLWRSVIAAVFPLFGVSLFENTGSQKYPVGWGSSILGFITLAMIAIPVLFYLNGPKLRARSKYAAHW